CTEMPALGSFVQERQESLSVCKVNARLTHSAMPSGHTGALHPAGRYDRQGNESRSALPNGPPTIWRQAKATRMLAKRMTHAGSSNIVDGLIARRQQRAAGAVGFQHGSQH